MKIRNKTMPDTRQLIRCWQSQNANKRAAVLYMHPAIPMDPPIFQGDTDGQAAGQVLQWMIDETALRCDRIEIAIH